MSPIEITNKTLAAVFCVISLLLFIFLSSAVYVSTSDDIKKIKPSGKIRKRILIAGLVIWGIIAEIITAIALSFPVVPYIKDLIM